MKKSDTNSNNSREGALSLAPRNSKMLPDGYFAVDFHVHSNRSYDGTADIVALAEAAHLRGLSGLAICDHRKAISSAELKAIVSPVLETRYNLTVNPDTPVKSAFYAVGGCEYATEYGHVLGLFLDSDAFSPEAEKAQYLEIVSLIRENGGIPVLAHPFEQLESSVTALSGVDFSSMSGVSGIEIHNSRADYKYADANTRALALFRREKQRVPSLVSTSGSDAHFIFELGTGGLVFKKTDGLFPSLASLRASLTSEKLSLDGRAKRRYTAKTAVIKELRRKRFGHALRSGVLYVRLLLKDIFKPL